MNLFLKRLLDICISFTLLIFLFPILIIISALVYTKLGSPIFFIQERPGLNFKPFKMIKFRTMKDSFDKGGTLLSDSSRMTRFGQKLRSSSFDELPELWNVLKGDMSLVGPRPLLMEYIPLYDDVQARRHEFLPGITGLAQVNGRNSLSWEDKFNLDIRYIDNYSLLLDIKILLSTIKKVLFKEGISAEGESTMPLFQGNKNNRKSQSSRLKN
mgnify:CR=1 FL=1